MLKTVLLLDGSDAVNSSADYLPTRLLALRPQLNRFVHEYLDSNPLASMAVVAMRDGLAHRLNSCTTNASEIIQALEVKYFLFGGSGAMSLENGLRLSLSELVDMKRITKRARQGNSGGGGGSKEIREEPVANLRIILISSSVTLIDPHDVFLVLKIVGQLHIRVDVISFCGAVHVFQEAALATGGTLYTPMNYDHLTDILHRLAMPEKNIVLAKGKQWMIQIGFPVYVEHEGKEEGECQNLRYYACPQCGLVQTSIPSTCPLCKLLLCSVPLIHTTFIAQNQLCTPSMEYKSGVETTGDDEKILLHTPCSLCQRRRVCSGEGGSMWQCGSCQCVRCSVCETYVRDSIGVCPTCIGSPM